MPLLALRVESRSQPRRRHSRDLAADVTSDDEGFSALLRLLLSCSATPLTEPNSIVLLSSCLEQIGELLNSIDAFFQHLCLSQVGMASVDLLSAKSSENGTIAELSVNAEGDVEDRLTGW